MKRKAVERKKKQELQTSLRASQHNNLPLQAHEHNFHLSKRFSNRTIYGIVGMEWNGRGK